MPGLRSAISAVRRLGEHLDSRSILISVDAHSECKYFACEDQSCVVHISRNNIVDAQRVFDTANTAKDRTKYLWILEVVSHRAVLRPAASAVRRWSDAPRARHLRMTDVNATLEYTRSLCRSIVNCLCCTTPNSI